MASLTPRQQQILGYVKEYLRLNGLAPTYDEIGAEFGICKVTVLEHVRQLARKGLVRHVPYAARAIEVCETGRDPRIPVAGVIQAGRPILAVEENEKVDLMELIPLGEDLFALQVRGDSMIAEHIQEGDYVIIRKAPAARPGEVVVALVDGDDATLKRCYPEGPNVRLEPSNPRFEPIVVPRERVRIQGVLQGVLRLYR